MMKPCSRLLLAGVLFASPAFAQEHQHEPAPKPTPQSAAAPAPPQGERPSLVAMKIAERPKIDGALDEALWATAPMVDRFIQQEPRQGQPASDRKIGRAHV